MKRFWGGHLWAPTQCGDYRYLRSAALTMSWQVSPWKVLAGWDISAIIRKIGHWTCSHWKYNEAGSLCTVPLGHVRACVSDLMAAEKHSSPWRVVVLPGRSSRSMPWGFDELQRLTFKILLQDQNLSKWLTYKLGTILQIVSKSVRLRYPTDIPSRIDY